MQKKKSPSLKEDISPCVLKCQGWQSLFWLKVHFPDTSYCPSGNLPGPVIPLKTKGETAPLPIDPQGSIQSRRQLKLQSESLCSPLGIQGGWTVCGFVQLLPEQGGTVPSPCFLPRAWVFQFRHSPWLLAKIEACFIHSLQGLSQASSLQKSPRAIPELIPSSPSGPAPPAFQHVSLASPEPLRSLSSCFTLGPGSSPRHLGKAVL